MARSREALFQRILTEPVRYSNQRLSTEAIKLMEGLLQKDPHARLTGNVRVCVRVCACGCDGQRFFGMAADQRWREAPSPRTLPLAWTPHFGWVLGGDFVRGVFRGGNFAAKRGGEISPGNHLEERLLDQAQVRASYTPLFDI